MKKVHLSIFKSRIITLHSQLTKVMYTSTKSISLFFLLVGSNLFLMTSCDSPKSNTDTTSGTLQLSNWNKDTTIVDSLISIAQYYGIAHVINSRAVVNIDKRFKKTPYIEGPTLGNYAGLNGILCINADTISHVGYLFDYESAFVEKINSDTLSGQVHVINSSTSGVGINGDHCYSQMRNFVINNNIINGIYETHKNYGSVSGFGTSYSYSDTIITRNQSQITIMYSSRTIDSPSLIKPIENHIGESNPKKVSFFITYFLIKLTD